MKKIKIVILIFLGLFLLSFLLLRLNYWLRSCHPPEPYLSETAQNWLLPDSSSEIIFTSAKSSHPEQKIFKTFSRGEEFYGGDECGSSSPNIISEYDFIADNDSTSLLVVKAFRSEVIFNSGFEKGTSISYNMTHICEYDTETQSILNKSSNFDATVLDTLIENNSHKVIIINTKRDLSTDVRFQQLKFIQGIGLVSYVDTNGTLWKRK